ncbi:efflux RND transporter periplasmic adaptor subunit [Gordonibacter pamelaeae]|uniref:efflux RND transporter periplasmic adaptor subunit n=2 Tax=Gordonibacter pamelaeae TaxID=471189 RepID=UPI0026700DD7|nr:efflux RND transporter periplasmic adaptor subunit [Gordonibacter pamelaeae]
MALRRNRRGDGADERASWGGGGAAPVSARPIGAPAGEDATARIVPAAPAVSAMPAAAAASAAAPGPQAASGATAALAGTPHPDVAGPADPLRTADLVDAEALADMQAFNDLKARRKKQKRKKIIIGAVSAVAVLAVAGGAFAWCTADQAAKALQDRAPQTAFVEQGTFTETVSASGNLQPVASVSATPEVDGIVGEVLVSEGDAVAEGQTLFTVVNDELDKAVKQAAQGIEEARNGVAQAQNAVNDAYHAKSAGQQAAAEAQAQAQAAAAAASEAATAGGSADATAGQAAGSPASFDEASADSAIRSAELGLSNANLALRNAQSAYDEAVARAAKRTVTASIAGSVVAVNIEPGKALGAAAGAATSPVQIADLSQMTVSINVNEIDILKITADQTAEVTFTAAPDLTLPATVVSIATTSAGSGDASGGALYGGSMGGAVTYAVKLLIAEPDPRLKPGMTAKATITTTTIDNALMVPISAVQSDGAGGSFVMVVTDPETQDVAQRKVEVVASDGLTSVVKGALKPGDQVVAGGMEGLGGAGGGYAVADGSSGMGMAVSDVSAG